MAPSLSDLCGGLGAMTFTARLTDCRSSDSNAHNPRYVNLIGGDGQFLCDLSRSALVSVCPAQSPGQSVGDRKHDPQVQREGLGVNLRSDIEIRKARWADRYI